MYVCMLCLHQALSLLLPLRYSLVDIGGSWAQRQVVALTAIQAAIKGKQHTTALALIAELKVQVTAWHRRGSLLHCDNSWWTDRDQHMCSRINQLIAGHFSHVGLRQLRTKTQLTKAYIIHGWKVLQSLNYWLVLLHTYIRRYSHQDQLAGRCILHRALFQVCWQWTTTTCTPVLVLSIDNL